MPLDPTDCLLWCGISKVVAKCVSSTSVSLIDKRVTQEDREPFSINPALADDGRSLDLDAAGARGKGFSMHRPAGRV
jgi:hypothetical protein